MRLKSGHAAREARALHARCREVLHLYCPVKGSKVLFQGCSLTNFFFVCLNLGREHRCGLLLLYSTNLSRNSAPHHPTGRRALSTPSPTSALIRRSPGMVKGGHSASHRQVLLPSTGYNLSVATGLCPAVWDDLARGFQ